MTFCNTTAGSYPIFRGMIALGHDHGGFYGPLDGTGEIVCVCTWRFTRDEVEAAAEKAAVAA